MLCKKVIHVGLILLAVISLPIERLEFFAPIGEFNELEYSQEIINAAVPAPKLKSKDIQNQRIV